MSSQSKNQQDMWRELEEKRAIEKLNSKDMGVAPFLITMLIVATIMAWFIFK